MSVTTYTNGIPIVSIPVSIASSPTNLAPTLLWYGLASPAARYYQWTTTLTVTNQLTSGAVTRQKLRYNGQDINVGSWIASLSTGLAWQITAISSKTSGSVSCTIRDVNRYNTYRNPAQNGQGIPSTGSYVVFNLAADGTPIIDPVPAGASTSFLSVLTSRFAYINKQFDISLNQPGFTPITGFNFGDVIAIDQPTQTFVLADSSHLDTVVGTVTAVDDSGTTFTLNPTRKVVGDLDYLPGDVGDVVYTDNSTPGGLTISTGGTPVYMVLRQNTQTITYSANFASIVVPITTPGYTFNVNGHLATIGGTGIPLDIVNAVNFITSLTGVTAVLLSGPDRIEFTAVDARAINFADVSGSVTTDAGLTSAENGVKAAGIIISGTSSGSTPPAGLTNSYGYVHVQSSTNTTWTITHNAATRNVVAQIYDNFVGPDAAGSAIFPDQISIVDINTIQVTFQAAQAGTALLTIFK